jgi:hypothetical protein
VNLQSEIPDKTPISGIKKQPYPHTGGAKYGQKTTTNKNTKHTIEFSNNTRACFRPLRGNPASLIWSGRGVKPRFRSA